MESSEVQQIFKQLIDIRDELQRDIKNVSTDVGQIKVDTEVIKEKLIHKVDSTDITGIINLAVNERITQQAQLCRASNDKKNTGDYKIPMKEVAPLLKWIILGVVTGLMALVSSGVIGH